MTDPFIDVLFAYDSWANRQLFEEILHLSQDELERPLGLGHGNIEQTLLHIIGGMIFFADRLERRIPRPRPDRDNIRRTPGEIVQLFDTADREFQEAIIKTVEAHALTDILNWTDDDLGEIDPLDQIPYAIALAQMIDHNVHHRTQVIDMLGLVGINKPMDWHPFEWDETTRSKN
ncbi:MAG: DinB family protein [Anaerolineales bacterium]